MCQRTIELTNIIRMAFPTEMILEPVHHKGSTGTTDIITEDESTKSSSEGKEPYEGFRTGVILS
jgi:hypothetical protein